MAGFTSYDDLLTEITVNGKTLTIPIMKTGSTMKGAGFLHSLWKAAGVPPAGGAPGTTPGAATNNELGSLWLPDEASDHKFLTTLEIVSNQQGAVILYDRLIQVGGINLVGTGAKTINSATLTRYTDGRDLEAWVEITTQYTTTTPVGSLNSYTDENGNTGVAGPSFTWPTVTGNVDMLVPVPLATKGIRAAATFNLTAAPSAGVANFLIVKRLATIPVAAGYTGSMIDFVRAFPKLPQLYNGASLGLAFWPSTTSAVSISGQATFAWG
jgi:hypothetical protein